MIDFSSLKTGLGIDIHAFSKDRPLILGGVEIPHYQGLDGHSDADVLTHAIMDSLLGAAKLGDIGDLFPDTDDKFKDANSLSLLSEVASLLHKKGFSIVDVDSVITAQKPKITPYKSKMQENIARAMNVGISSVGIKATTTEQLGFVGREEGIAAFATAIIQKDDI